MKDYEKRFIRTPLETTEEGKLVGYAAVFNSRSADLGGFREIIAPGAFKRTLKENPDVLGVVEHEMKALMVLGRTTSGTLTLAEDEHGLRFEIDLPDTQAGRDLKELIRRGDVSGCSFQFRPYQDGSSIDYSTAPATRTLTAVQLREISIVTSPAYADTEVSLRSILSDAEIVAVKNYLRRMRLELEERS